MPRLTIDKDACHGHGRCCAISPDLFEGGDNGFGAVIREEITAADLGSAQRAIDNCRNRRSRCTTREVTAARYLEPRNDVRCLSNRGHCCARGMWDYAVERRYGDQIG